MGKALAENLDYVVFSGAVGSLVGGDALTAAVGETVRLFVGNGGPNLISSFHVIGEIFDRGYTEAGSAVADNVQTTLVPVRGAAMVEFEMQVPGNYILNPCGPRHFPCVQQGCSWDHRGHGAEGESAGASTTAERIAFGERVYTANCSACHQAQQRGHPRR